MNTNETKQQELLFKVMVLISFSSIVVMSIIELS
jgi:hypothetical protein